MVSLQPRFCRSGGVNVQWANDLSVTFLTSAHEASCFSRHSFWRRRSLVHLVPSALRADNRRRLVHTVLQVAQVTFTTAGVFFIAVVAGVRHMIGKLLP